MFLVNLEFHATLLLQNTVQIHTVSCGGGGCSDGDEFQLISPHCSQKVFILSIK